MRLIAKLVLMSLFVTNIWSSSALSDPPGPKETKKVIDCSEVIKAADEALKAKQEALEKANEAIKEQSIIVEGKTKEAEDATAKLGTLPHNTYAIGGLGVSGGILLASGVTLPGVGVLVGIIIIGLFK